MKAEVNESGDIKLTEIYNGIEIAHEKTSIGVACRDFGIEITLFNGESIFIEGDEVRLTSGLQ